VCSATTPATSRRELDLAELRAKFPIGRVVAPADVATLAFHPVTNAALTGATYDSDGGQRFMH
jgi:NAD(P)-dependent dehydrogenase (short-subunit alcohol dehydrogenase family)